MKAQIFILTLLIFIPALAMADEKELYKPLPPADSAFVRFVNLTDTKADAAKIGDVTIAPGEKTPVSDYSVVKKGKRTFYLGEKTSPVSVEAGQYYTVVVPADGSITVIQDALIENPAKAVIYFYNLSDSEEGTLVAPTHKTNIFEKVGSMKSESREINAVTFNLQAKAGKDDAGTIEGVNLKRQEGTSVFLTGKKGSYKSFSVQNAVAE